jgi:dihydroorotate dehydrogenase electron transfer subunit
VKPRFVIVVARGKHLLMSASVAAARNQFIATVAANLPLCTEHYRLVLRLPEFPATQPGQFIQIACRDVDEDDDAREQACEVEWQPGRAVEVCVDDLATPSALLRRPFSLAGRRNIAGGGGVELDIIHRVVGVGTDWLSRLRADDAVSILGPLGNTFRLPSPQQTAVLVGGGVGIPPMLYLAEKLAGRRAVAFCGALRRDLLPLTITADASPAGDATLSIDEFARHGIASVITTDDGSFGFRGFVTQALERQLDGGLSGKPLVIYTCGPELMMKRVADIAAARGIECQIAVERAMACGMGTCQSCCIKVRKPDPAKPPLPGSDWCYRLACTDGPVFLGKDLLW